VTVSFLKVQKHSTLLNETKSLTELSDLRNGRKLGKLT